jgi:hypothetical protein
MRRLSGLDRVEGQATRAAALASRQERAWDECKRRGSALSTWRSLSGSRGFPGSRTPMTASPRVFDLLTRTLMTRSGLVIALLAGDDRGAWSAVPRLGLEYFQERKRERGPVLAGERGELARHGGLQATDCGVELVWDDVARDEGDSESGGGEVGGRRNLSGLHNPARDETGACAHVEDEFRQAVIRSEENPVAIGEVFECHRASAGRERIGSWEDDDELFPSEVGDGSSPLVWSGADSDVADACTYCVLKCSSSRSS